MNHNQGYKTSHQTKKANTKQKPRRKDGSNNKLSDVKNSVRNCIGLMDGLLCCASLSHVSAEDRNEGRGDNLRQYVTSYDLGYLNSNVGDGRSSSATYSSNSADSEAFQPSKSKNPSVQRSTTQAGCWQQHTPATAGLHTILPISMLPRDYGFPEPPSTGDNYDDDDDASCLQQSMFRVIGTVDEDEDEDNSCFHSSFQRFHGFDDGCGHESQYTQPRTFTSSDTYSTVSMSQSHAWDDDDEDEEANSDYLLSPRGSVFREDERMEEAPVQHDGPSSCSPSPSFPASCSLVTKTHEAYQYLLRMAPQNYMHGSGSSDDMEYNDGELDDAYRYSNRTNSILGSNSSSSTIDLDHCGAIFLK